MTNNVKSGAQLVATYFMALAMFSLAGALVYFAFEVSRVSTQIPNILTSVDRTSENIEPIISEVGEIRLLIPDILHEVEQTRLHIPAILKEVEQTRQQIPPILKEVEAVRKEIPPILNETQAVRKEIPAVLKSADKASNAVVVMSKEIKATRPLIRDVVTEVETTRESIPPMMDRADELIEKAHIAGKQASEGAVTGIVSGIFTAPFTMVGDVLGMSKEEAKLFSKKDIKMFNLTVNELLNVGSVGDKKEWDNPESGTNGRVEILRFYEGEGDAEFEYADCSEVKIKAFKEGEVVYDHQKSYCKDDEGKWNLINND